MGFKVYSFLFLTVGNWPTWAKALEMSMAKMVSWYDGGRGYTGKSCRRIPFIRWWVELYHLKPCLLGRFELLWGPFHPKIWCRVWKVVSDNQLILDFKASNETNKLPALFIPIFGRKQIYRHRYVLKIGGGELWRIFLDPGILQQISQPLRLVCSFRSWLFPKWRVFWWFLFGLLRLLFKFFFFDWDVFSFKVVSCMNYRRVKVSGNIGDLTSPRFNLRGSKYSLSKSCYEHMSRDQNTGYLLYIGDYTIYLYRNHKPS